MLKEVLITHGILFYFCHSCNYFFFFLVKRSGFFCSGPLYAARHHNQNGSLNVLVQFIHDCSSMPEHCTAAQQDFLHEESDELVL